MPSASALLAAALALLLAPASAAPPSDALSSALAAVPFGNAAAGLTNNSDAYGQHALQCYYLEVENVTCTSCSWGGACAVQTLLPAGSSPPSKGCSAQSPAAPNVDRPGGDMSSAPSASFDTCAATCCANAGCVAWVFVTRLQAGQEDQCVTNGTCCWLKGSVPAQSPLNYPGGIWSGTVTQPATSDVVPPTGIRNAVPVGGLGAGTMELRGDGTFHELTFHSASPGGAAKYATQPDMLVSYKVGGGGAARAVRTAPQPWAAPGVAQLAYRGTYPVSRLDIVDPSSLGAAGVSASLFFYHHLRPNDSPTSSAPAAVLTLSVTNNGASATNVSLLFQMPMGAMRDCARVDFKATSTSSAPSYAACMHSCGAGCGAWNFDSAAGACALLPSAGRMVYARGSFCGVRGAWDSSDGQMLTLAMHPGDAPSESGPAVGDVSLRPVASGAGAALSFAVSDDPAALYAAFAVGGGFAPGTNGGVTGGSFAAVQAAHGAVAVTSPMVAPGETASVSVTLTWYFPNRDYYGLVVGQFYSTLFGSSKDVAGLYDEAHLEAVAADVAAHTSVFAGAGSASFPPWLADHMVNQFSHFRNFIYAAINDDSSNDGGGMMREHEANDCPDLDSASASARAHARAHARKRAHVRQLARTRAHSRATRSPQHHPPTTPRRSTTTTSATCPTSGQCLTSSVKRATSTSTAKSRPAATRA